jgi:hypothetical protein
MPPGEAQRKCPRVAHGGIFVSGCTAGEPMIARSVLCRWNGVGQMLLQLPLPEHFHFQARARTGREPHRPLLSSRCFALAKPKPSLSNPAHIRCSASRNSRRLTNRRCLLGQRVESRGPRQVRAFRDGGCGRRGQQRSCRLTPGRDVGMIGEPEASGKGSKRESNEGSQEAGAHRHVRLVVSRLVRRLLP